MNIITNKPSTCLGCSLYDIGAGFIQPEGTGAIPLLMVGESPGFNEAQDSLPFRPQAQAGSLLHRVMQRARIDRNSISMFNLCACRPPSDKLLGASYEYSAVNHCRIHFDKVIERYKPRVILALGGLPFKHLTGMEGYKLNISTARGYVFKCVRYPDVVVVPSYHPSFIRRGNLHLMGVLMQDMMKSIYIGQGKLIEDRDFILDPMNYNTRWNSTNLHTTNTPLINYITSPTVAEAKYFLAYLKQCPDSTIAYDIETTKSVGIDEDEFEEYDSHITQIQFSTDKYSGIAFPFEEPFIEIAKQIMALSNTKIGWNSDDFDSPILRQAGFAINGDNIDLMWMMHHQSADLPLGLQYCASFAGFPFAWKNYSNTNLAFYGIADVTSLHYLYEYLKKQLTTRGMWDGYWNYVYKLKPILIDIQDRGLPINVEKQTKFGEEIDVRKTEIIEELKPLIPLEFEKLNKKDGYVREPQLVKSAKIKYMLQENNSSAIAPAEFIEKECGFVLRDFVIGDKLSKQEQELVKMGVSFPDRESRVEKRWVRLVEFNPNSVDDVSNLVKINEHEELARKLTVKLSKELDTEDEIRIKKANVSTSKALLKKLVEKTGYDGYRLIVEYKELGKMKGTYIEGYKTDQDNRVHTTYTFRPASGQLSSRNPNIQNYPVHSKLAEKFKGCIEAKAGHLIVSLDYRGFHNKMMGFLAQDPVYLRVASLDTHSFVTGHVVGFPDMDSCLELADNDLIFFLNKIKKQYKKLRDDQIKHVVHGINFGLSEEGCYKRYSEEFNPKVEDVIKRTRREPSAEQLAKLIEQGGKKRVKDVYTIVKKLFPAIFSWQDRTIVEADTKGFIQTPFGARRWFFAASEIKYNRWGKVERIVKGEQAEQALAFPVSNNSHYHMRESMLLLEELGLNKKYNLVNMVHDSLVFEPLEKDLDDCVKEVRKVMERESDTLKNELMQNGFWCSVDAKVGNNLANAKEI